MRYYAVHFPNHTTLIMKTDYAYKNFLNLLLEHKAVRSLGGTIYNLKQFQSFYELTEPDARHKRAAITLDELI